MSIQNINGDGTLTEVDHGRREAWFTCECDSTEHSVRFMYWMDKDTGWTHLDEDDGLWVDVHLSTGGFFHRLTRAVKYLFGYHCKYGHFDGMMFSRRDAERLHKLTTLFANSPLINYEGPDQSIVPDVPNGTVIVTNNDNTPKKS